jgi:hypothetical protein
MDVGSEEDRVAGIINGIRPQPRWVGIVRHLISDEPLSFTAGDQVGMFGAFDVICHTAGYVAGK